MNLKPSDLASSVRTGLSCLSLAWLALALAAPAPLFAATPPPPAAAQPAATPSSEELSILVHATLLALSQANQTGNYTVLRALTSRDFQVRNTPEQLAAAFHSFRDDRIDLAPIVLYAPVWSPPPSLQNGVLRLVGYFPTRPREVAFDLIYVREDGAWRIAGLAASLPLPRR